MDLSGFFRGGPTPMPRPMIPTMGSTIGGGRMLGMPNAAGGTIGQVARGVMGGGMGGLSRAVQGAAGGGGIGGIGRALGGMASGRMGGGSPFQSPKRSQWARGY